MSLSLKNIIFLKFSTLILILTILCTGMFTIFSIKNYVKEEKRIFAIRAETISGELLKYMIWNDRFSIKKILDNEVKLNPSVNYVFIEKEGKPYSYTFKNGIPKKLLNLKKGKIPPTFIYQFKNVSGNVFYDISVGLPQFNSRLHLGLKKDSIMFQMKEQLFSALMIGFWTIVIGVAFAYFLSVRMTSDIKTLSDAIISYTTEDEAVVDITAGKKAVKNIVSTFNTMKEKQFKTSTALEENRRKLSIIASEWSKTFDAIDNPIALVDKDGKIIRCNRAQKERLGLDYKKIIGINLHKTFHSSSSDSNVLIKRMKISGKREIHTFRKGPKWYKNTVDPIFDNDGNITGAVHVSTDITESVKSEKELKRQREFFQTAINSLTHPFYIIDVETHEIVLKNSASELFYPKKTKRCYEITHGRKTPCTGEEHPCPIIEIKKNSKPFVVEHNHINSKGVKYIHEVHGFPIFNAEGRITRIIEYCLDITEKKNSELMTLEHQREMIRADKFISLGILVSGVAHEINNPNNSILLNSRFLKKVWSDVEPIVEEKEKDNPDISFGGIKYKNLKEKLPSLFSGISDSSNRIKLIVEDLKNYSRKSSQHDKEIVNINTVIKSAVNLMNSFINKSTFNFTLNLDENLPYIRAGYQKMEQVIINLIQNSCHSLESKNAGITISSKTGKNADNIIISVSDEGCGIKKEDLKLITEPFFTTKRETGGTGLGLSVSEKIINDHNGKMMIKSKPGKGTTVDVIIPVMTGEKTGK